VTQRFCLGAHQTQEIAVEVDPVGGGAVAHALDRTILVRAVEDRHILVPIRVVDRCEERHRGLCQLRPAAEGDVAQDHQGGIFAIDLAGVDAALDEQDRLAGGSRRLRREGAVRGHDDQGQRSTLAGAAEVGDPNQLGRRRFESVEIDHRLVVARSGAEIGFLRDSEPFVRKFVGGGNECREEHGDCEKGGLLHGGHSS